MSSFFVNSNDEILSADAHNIKLNNRAFRYGDGLFESVRVVKGKVVGLDAHLDRLFKGMEALKINKPADYAFSFFNTRIEQLIVKNEIDGGGRVRICVYRDNGGYFTPNNHFPLFTIEALPYEDATFQLNQVGLTVDIYPDMRKAASKVSAFKTASSLPYILAGLYAQERDWDDCLLQNTKFDIIESTNSNLFIVSNGVLYTPGLESGCVGGTMRMRIINLAIDNGIRVYESNITPQNLLVADELFLTNAIAGIRWVSSYKTKRYFHNTATQLVELLNGKYAG